MKQELPKQHQEGRLSLLIKGNILHVTHIQVLNCDNDITTATYCQR
jgi:hypothetical protein